MKKKTAAPVVAAPRYYRCPRCGEGGPEKLYVYGGVWFRATGDCRDIADEIEIEPPRPDATTMCLKVQDDGTECGHRDAFHRFLRSAPPPPAPPARPAVAARPAPAGL